jgi:hypothetical protein
MEGERGQSDPNYKKGWVNHMLSIWRGKEEHYKSHPGCCYMEVDCYAEVKVKSTVKRQVRFCKGQKGRLCLSPFTILTLEKKVLVW